MCACGIVLAALRFLAVGVAAAAFTIPLAIPIAMPVAVPVARQAFRIIPQPLTFPGDMVFFTHK